MSPDKIEACANPIRARVEFEFIAYASEKDCCAKSYFLAKRWSCPNWRRAGSKLLSRDSAVMYPVTAKS